MPPKVTPAGDRALLVDLGATVSASELHARAAAVRAQRGVVACIAGHQSLYVIFDGEPHLDLRDVAPASFTPREHIVQVDFSGPDLEALLVRVRREEFLARVATLRLTARYLGFRGGWAYLERWPDDWEMPRRPTSRNLVPRGSFAVAGTMAGFYPIDTPGGWNLLGRTNAVPPIEPGDVIALQPATITRFDTAEPLQPSGEVIADVVTPGQLTIATARPFDPLAAAIANRAVGNDDTAPLLECVLVAPEIRTSRRTAFVDSTLAVRTPARAGRIEHGLRAYVAVEGGVAEMPRPLRAGDVLRAWPRLTQPKPRRAGLRPAESRWMSERGHAEILIVRGPHDAPPLAREWIVTPQLDRVGIRLRPVIASSFVPPADLPSCGMQPGTLQWHPDGSVVAMGPDHPITGGYLQPATIVSADVWKLAYLQPGDRVTFIE